LAWVFLTVLAIGVSPEWLPMRKKTLALPVENDFPVDLTLHKVPASLLTEFSEEIVRPYFKGNLNVAVQELLRKALAEQDFVFSHITAIREATGV
jgi:hypothetical protein